MYEQTEEELSFFCRNSNYPTSLVTVLGLQLIGNFLSVQSGTK